MRRKGFELRRNPAMGMRDGDASRDTDLHGRPVTSNDVAFVRLSKCRIYEKDGRMVYDASQAPTIPITYGGTYYGYGQWNTRHSEVGVRIDGRIHHDYMQCTVYFAEDGLVYTGSIKRALPVDRREAK